jgi:YbbR domain-containing protein
MIPFLRGLIKNLPTLLIAIIMAVSAWTAAVISSDPNELSVYSQPINVEFLGQDPQLIVLGSPIRQVKVTINAPRSVWASLTGQTSQINAFVDLSGLSEGTYQLPVQVQVNTKPVEVVQISPEAISVTLERMVNQTYKVQLVTNGNPAVGYQAEEPVISPENVAVSGPQTMVNQIQQIRAIVDLNQVKQNIQNSLLLQAVDANGDTIEGVTISPERISINIPVTQKGGYRNVVIKVVTQGKLADGYRLTNISIYPPNVTVYSSDPLRVESLPGYVDTMPILLDNIRSDLILPIELNLPEGISLVGVEQITLQAGIAAIESSLTLSRLPIQVEGLATGYAATVSPEVVDVILSGPLPLLEQLTSAGVQVTINLSEMEPGTYQITPNVTNDSEEIRIDSVLPATIEVVIQSSAPTLSPTSTP